jgi:GNAT superfamily N-acetyltransferase
MLNYTFHHLIEHPQLIKELSILLEQEWPQDKSSWYDILTNRIEVDQLSQTWILREKYSEANEVLTNQKIIASVCLIEDSKAPISLARPNFVENTQSNTIIWIDSLWVHPSFRSRGLSTSLIREIIKELSGPFFNFCHNNIHILTHTNNADYVFKKLSFEAYNKVENDYNLLGRSYHKLYKKTI